MRVLTTTAGDRLEVGIGGRFDGERVVRAVVGAVELQPNEARRLGIFLIETAHAVERRQGGQR